ncbi:MAG: hypothetical protein AAB599_03860 [Patescibacteria group bacterium]
MAKRRSKNTLVKRLKGFAVKAVPLWLVLLLVLNTSLISLVVQGYFVRKEIRENLIQLAKTTENSDELVEILKQEVLPASGHTTQLRWRALGGQLVEAGAIDPEKYKQIFAEGVNGSDHMKYLDGEWDEPIFINETNSRFMVNTLWALGLVNKSKVLDEGPMRKDPSKTGNFASTGGWSLGKMDAMKLYSSRTIIPLTQEQQELVRKVAEGVFRPCCNNSTAFPDCNHGMAALGYIQLAVYNGISEEQIYKDLLAFNSFWFPQTYIEQAVYWKKQGVEWKKVDPKVILSSEYSSSSGASRVRQAIQDIPAFKNQGGGCGV